MLKSASVEDLGDDACTYRSATLTDRKTQALFHRNRRNQRLLQS